MDAEGNRVNPLRSIFITLVEWAKCVLCIYFTVDSEDPSISLVVRKSIMILLFMTTRISRKSLVL